MTRKDYEAIEYVLRSRYSMYNGYPATDSIKLGVVFGIANDIADELAEGNKAFDREHFLAVVRGEREIGSRPPCKRHTWKEIRSYGATTGYDAQCAVCGEKAFFAPREE